MFAMPDTDKDHRHGYTFLLNDGASSAHVFVEAANVEYACAEKLVIEPTLEGRLLYLQFDSPGDGFARLADDRGRPPVTLRDLVEGFLEGSELKETGPTEYAKAVRELYVELNRVQLLVREKALSIGVMPDAFDEEAFSQFQRENAHLVKEWGQDE